jgi:hypothetical protein
MKDKVIFWFGSDFTQFCMSYYFQKKYDCDMYSIVDITDITKSFFKNQKLVDFKKTWYLHEQYDKTNEKPDIDYLKFFENKYNIDLWKLVINERMFYNFNDFYKFQTNEILSIIEQICKFYERFFLEVKPDFFITKLTAFHHLELFRKMCVYHGTKILMLSNPKISNKNIISEDDAKIDYVDNLDNIQCKEKSFSELRNTVESLNAGLPMQKQLLGYWEKHASHSLLSSLRPLLRYIISSNSNVQTHYNYYGRTKLRVVINAIKLVLKKKYRENFMQKNLVSDYNLNSQYVYFALGIVLERHILLGTPYFTNQIELIRHIAKSLPIGYTLLVKEHPGQGSREWRKISEYQEIIDIPNVILLHPKYSESDLQKNASLVLSTSGTTSFEAALFGKSSIVFGDVIYSYLRSVKKVNSIDDLSKIIKTSLKIKPDSKDLSKYIEVLSGNLIDFNFAEFLSDFNKIFTYNGGYIDVKINENDLHSFIKNRESSLDYLAICHIQKIKQHKNQHNV